MERVAVGNHTAVVAARSERDRIRQFYRGVLGCEVRVQSDEVDRFALADFHFCFVYQGAALGEGDFRRAPYLELKAHDVAAVRQRILAFGVTTLDGSDPHLYFHAPGGQVFRLVGIDEDLSLYEGSPSWRPLS